MNEKTFRPRFINFLTLFVLCFLLNAPIFAQPEEINDLVFVKFNEAKKAPCGQRDEAVKIGKEIIEKYADNKENQAVIEFVRKKVLEIEKQDKVCKEEEALAERYRKSKTLQQSACIKSIDETLKTPKIKREEQNCIRNERYEQSYVENSWDSFFAISREIIAKDYNSPTALDTALTAASVGHYLTAYRKIDRFNSETVFYAERAIDLLEDGVKTKKYWGVFEGYETKENALAWMNYIVGYITYFRDKKKSEGIKYLYRATLYESEFKHDAFMYQAVAIYYFDKTEVSVSPLAIDQFIREASDKSQNIYGGTNNLQTENKTLDGLALLRQKLVVLYKMRYNLEKDENVNGLEDYIYKLINRPLIDSSADVKRSSFRKR